MSSSPRMLIVYALVCTLAAAIFGFGSSVFAFQSSLAESIGRAELIVLTRLAIFIFLGILLVFRGGWWGVLAAVLMSVGATFIEWAIFPLSYELAVAQAPKIPDGASESVERPAYLLWSLQDIVAVGLCAALAQGLRLFAGFSPATRGE